MGLWTRFTDFLTTLLPQDRADRAAWDQRYAQFGSQVLNPRDRARLWRKRRPRHEGPLRELDEVHADLPSPEDLACLDALVSERESWR